MSRGQRELSIAQRRRRRHVSSARSNVNDLLGMPWKEERDLRKAIYDSLREQHMMASHNQRSVSRQSTFRSKKASLPAGKPRKTALRVGESTKVDKAKKVEPSISSCPHPRKSRPLPGSLSHACLLTSAYLRSLASATAARRSLARASSIAKPRPQHLVAHTAISSNNQALKRRSGVGKLGLRGGGSAAPPKVSRENGRMRVKESIFEVLVEADDGKFVPQIMPAGPTRANGSQSLSSTATLPRALWQDSQGLPVDTHDFVDFLCYYGTPCLSEKLAWFADPPSRRVFSTGQANGGGGGGGGRKAAPTPVAASPTATTSPMGGGGAGAAVGASAASTLHKTPIFVARKTASIASQPLNASTATAAAVNFTFSEPPTDVSASTPTTPKDDANGNKKKRQSEASPSSALPPSPPQTPTSCSTSPKEHLGKKVLLIRQKPSVNKKADKSKTRTRLSVGRADTKKSMAWAASVTVLHRSQRISSNSSASSTSNLRSGLRSQARNRTRHQQRLRYH